MVFGDVESFETKFVGFNFRAVIDRKAHGLKEVVNGIFGDGKGVQVAKFCRTIGSMCVDE